MAERTPPQPSSASPPSQPAASAPGAGGAARRSVPRPGEIYDPVARALDVIGDRWSLVLVRHLLLGPKGFQELRMRTGIAPRVLSSRLRDLVANGFVESADDGPRSPYRLTDRGRTLEPIVAAIARWFTREGARALSIDGAQFTETSPRSILESLPFLLREDRAADGAAVTFEIRLTGEGGGVWTVQIADGTCRVSNDFADRADVRYTADARVWCGVALGILDARDVVKRDLMTKEGSGHAMDQYFHQIYRPGRRDGQDGEAGPTRAPRDQKESSS